MHDRAWATRRDLRSFVPNDAVLAVATTELRALGGDGKRQLSHYASTPPALTPYMATQLEQAIVFRLCAKLGKVGLCWRGLAELWMDSSIAL